MIPHNRWANRSEYEGAVLSVMRAGHPAQGPIVDRLERELAERFRPNGEACCVSSGSAALRLALILLGDDSVWVPTYACPALWYAAASVSGAAGQHVRPLPQLRDCDPATFNTATATVVVDTYGLPADVRPWQIEDFTHAPGAPGAGSRGAFSVISFGATKPLGAGGGGALLGPRDAIRRARAMRDYDDRPILEPWAFNHQMSDLHAAIVRERLGRLEEDNAWRMATAALYLAAGQHCVQGGRRLAGRVWYRYVVRVHDWRVAVDRFAAAGIEVINPLRPDELLHRRAAVRGGLEFPGAETVAASTVSLPIWPGMTDEQCERVALALAELAA